MFKKLATIFSSKKMTILSGIFLGLSLILLISKSVWELEINAYLDPAWVTIIISGYPLIFSAINKLFSKRKITSALLISVAMIASICIKEVFAAGEVAFIMAIGEILEDVTVDKAKEGLNKLISLTPVYARLVKTNEQVSVKEVKVGMLVRVLPGEIIPVDGKIVVGETSVDQSILTGESIPVDKIVGDNVLAGTMNCYGSIDIETTKENENTSLQKMIRLVEEAENQKAPTERLADKWASWLVPVALFIAVIVGIVTNYTIGNENNVALIRAVTILVVFCPCALALSTPTSVMAGIGQATKYGIIIKSGAAIEEMGKVNLVAFDKTGTITHGKLEVSDVISFSDLSDEEIIKIISSIESYSEHPLGRAICDYALNKQVEKYQVEEFKMYPGLGVSGKINNQQYYCGNLKYLNQVANNNSELEEIFNKLRNEGKVLIVLANNEEILGVIGLSDTIRDASKEVIRKLKKMGVEVVLLTGDHYTTAKYVAEKVGISKIRADLLPEDKVKAIKDLQQEGYVVSMIGDGVNDAASLKTANIGIAMGDIGSDITVEASDITLLSDDILKIPYLKRLAKGTFNTIKLNITLSMFINFAAIILSTLGILNPITGAFVHNAGSVLVILNAALVYNRKYLEKLEKM